MSIKDSNNIFLSFTDTLDDNEKKKKIKESTKKVS